jgi:hypothetical protein
MDYFTFIILILLIISIANNFLMYNKNFFYSNKLESDIKTNPDVGVITPKIYYSKHLFTENQIKQKINANTNGTVNGTINGTVNGTVDRINKIDGINGIYISYNPVNEADYLNINALGSKCSKSASITPITPMTPMSPIPKVEGVIPLIESSLKLSESESETH